MSVFVCEAKDNWEKISDMAFFTKISNFVFFH